MCIGCRMPTGRHLAQPIHTCVAVDVFSEQQTECVCVCVYTIAKFPSSGKMKWVCRFTRRKIRRKKWHIEMGVFHHPTFAIYLPHELPIAYCCSRFCRHRRYYCAHRCFNVWCGRKMCRHSYIHIAVVSDDGCHFASFSGTFSTLEFHYQGPWSQVHPCNNYRITIESIKLSGELKFYSESAAHIATAEFTANLEIHKQKWTVGSGWGPINSRIHSGVLALHQHSRTVH